MPDANVVQLRLAPGGVARRCAGDPRLAPDDRVACQMPTFGEERCYFHSKIADGLIGTYGLDAKPAARWQ